MDYTIKIFVVLMRNGKYALIFSVLFLLDLLFCQHLHSQQINKSDEESTSIDIMEELYVTTDRDIYITGEQVWFKVYELNSFNHAPWEISRVVYLELLDKDNFPIKQMKVKTDGTSGYSGFTIPEKINTGNYVIRAYTNWMKNWPPEQFFYLTISVINPFENLENLKLPLDSTVAEKIDVLYDYGTVSENIEKLLKRPGYKSLDNPINYTITFQKKEYLSRENVIMVISATDAEGNPVESDLSVSVTKSALLNKSGWRTLSDFYDKGYLNSSLSIQYNLPELEGHLISGSMMSKTTGEPLSMIDISLAFVGKTARCQFGKTDENGEFNFVVKETGLNEIVIQPLSPVVAGYYVELKQPFSSKFSKYKSEVFYLDTSKIEDINNAIISMQVNNIYDSFRQPGKAASKMSIPDFYGNPENSIKMSDYIELTSIREVVKEIIPNVYTLKQNGQYDFKLINKFRGQPFENKPLVLIDGVPIYDIEKVLNINSKEIERVDITNTRYFFSENVFDGIISFITLKGNLSSIEFDNSIFRQVYEACQTATDFYSPDYNNNLIRENRIADFRNTLFWKPDLHTGKDGKAEIEFFTSDESVEYTIVVEGISSDGNRGLLTTSFIVK